MKAETTRNASVFPHFAFYHARLFYDMLYLTMTKLCLNFEPNFVYLIFAGYLCKWSGEVSWRIRLPSLLLFPFLQPVMAVLWRQRWCHSAIWRQQPIIGKSQVRIILDQRWEGGRRFSGEWDPGRKQGHCQSRKGPTPSREFGPIGKRGSHLCLQDLKSQEEDIIMIGFHRCVRLVYIIFWAWWSCCVI